MGVELHRKTKILICLIPLLLLCLYSFVASLDNGLHDFLNSYLPAKLSFDNIAPESIIFDIHDFNQYAWRSGHNNELLDYYLNSPFTATAFYPFVFLGDAGMAKIIFNCIGILLFLIAVYRLALHYLDRNYWVLCFLPILFFIPIHNQIRFGQSYFIVFSLVVIGYFQLSKQRETIGSGLLGFAVLLKVFPVFYGLPLLFSKRYKTIVWCIVLTLVLVLFSMSLTGYSLWEYYFAEVLPNAIRNKTIIDFRPNYQSFDVFFKTLFVRDAYYNPYALYHNESFYIWALWLVKAIVLGTAVFISIQKPKKLLELLAIWVVTLFLFQSRSATYAQILWIIPAFVIYKSETHKSLKLLFMGVLLLISNFPYYKLAESFILLRFLRLWMFVVAAVIFYVSIGRIRNARRVLTYVFAAFLLLLPLNLSAFKAVKEPRSEYVLSRKQHFMICGFEEKNGVLAYEAIGRKGFEEVYTTIKVSKFEPERCTISDNQLFVDGIQVTHTNSLKKNPVLVNDCDLYFLTDHRSRHGAFTLKKINICK